MSVITKILDPAYKSGVSAKSGKPWTLMKIEVDNKIQATCFAPAAEGDEVELKYNDQFKNYSAEKVTQKTRDNAQIQAEFTAIHEKLDRIISLVDNTTGPPPDLIEGPFEQEPF